MKNNILILLAAFLLCQCDDNLSNGNTTCLPDVPDKYVFASTSTSLSGMYEELGKAENQIPPGVLESISTRGLIGSFLDTPHLLEIYMASSAQPFVTLHSIYAACNSIDELAGRDGAGNALLVFLEDTGFDCLRLWDDTNVEDAKKQTAFSFQLAALEGLFTVPEILGQLTHKEKQALVGLLLQKHRQSRDVKFDGFKHSSIPVMNYVMYDDRYAPIVEYGNENPEAYEQSVKMGYLLSDDQADYIISSAESYIK
jgi:hypothetical protein